MEKKIHIDISIPFYNHNGDIHRTNLTKKIFKHYSNIRSIFKNRCNMTFTLVGSEGEISKNLALEYFNIDEYYEFDQSNAEFWSMLTRKFNFCFVTSRNKNPDIVFLAGSNDYICIDFFEQVITSYNNSIPQLFGIDNYHNGKNAVYFINFDGNTNMLINDGSIWWDGVSNYQNRSKYLYCGGIIGFNNTVYETYPEVLSKFNYDEGVIEAELLNVPNIQKFNSKEIFYFNTKTLSNNELNKMEYFSTIFPIKKLNFEIDFSIEMQNKIKKELYYFNNVETVIPHVETVIPLKKIGLYGSGQLHVCYSLFFNKDVLKENNLEIAFSLGFYDYDINYQYYNKKILDYSIFDNIDILIIDNNNLNCSASSSKIIDYCMNKNIKIIRLCALQFPVYPINWSGYGENSFDYINWSGLENIDYKIKFDNCINKLENSIKDTNMDSSIVYSFSTSN